MHKTIVVILLIFSTVALTAQVQEYEHFDDFKKERLTSFSEDTIYVINFWATWCKPCVKELPYFDQLEEIEFDKPTKVLLVSLDLQFTIESRLLPFIEKRNVKSEVIVLTDEDTNSWIDKISPNWSGALPATIIIRNQKQYFYEKTYESLEELKQEIINTKNP